jgi:hypothetical protein
MEKQKEQPKIYTALARGVYIEVFNADNGMRLYTLSLGSNFHVVAGPYVNGEVMTVYIQDFVGNRYLKTFNLKTGILKYTTSAN